MSGEMRVPHVYTLAGKSGNIPYTLAANPNLDVWVRFLPGDKIEIRTGKVELGQGIVTAIAQIAADELDVDLQRITMLPTDTAFSPNEGSTTGSRSIQEGGMAMRHVCAQIRAALLEAAAAKMNVSVDVLSVEDGIVRNRHSNETHSYWQLAPLVDFSRRADEFTATPKPIDSLKLAGTSVSRIDLPSKVSGAGFLQDIDLPGMLHGRVVRPPSFRARLLSIDSHHVAAMPGVHAVIRNGSFVGIVAEREEQAISAMGALAKACQWSQSADLPDVDALPEFLRNADADVEHLQNEPRDEPAAGDPIVATYSRPFLAHASVGPSCAIAHWHDDILEVWSHSQAIFALRDEIAEVLDLPVESVVARHAPGAGCYGHNGADDAALDAALLAISVKGSPVRLQWMREDEFVWEPFGPAMMVEITGQLTPSGSIAYWDEHIWGNRHIARPGRMNAPGLLAAWHIDGGYEEPPAVDMPLSMGGGGQRNAIPYYDFSGVSATNHALKVMPLRTSALRALGAHMNVFAIECFMDELACTAGIDPVEFRLRHLQDQRARDVLEMVVRMAEWQPNSQGDGSFGRGVAFSRYKNISTYAAVIVDIEIAETVRIAKVYAAVDCGRVINPDGALNQCEGGIIQAISWTLKEAVRFDDTQITSRNWDSYPILRFSEVPQIEVQLIHRPNEEPLGVGEGMAGPTSAAIGNAIFNAMNLRVRNLPFTQQNIVTAME